MSLSLSQTSPSVTGRVSADRSAVAALTLTTPWLVRKSFTNGLQLCTLKRDTPRLSSAGRTKPKLRPREWEVFNQPGLAKHYCSLVIAYLVRIQP